MGLDPNWQKSYDEHYRTLNPWLNQPRVPTSAGTVFRGLGAIIDHSASAVAAITIMRPKKRGNFASRDVALLRALVPHLQRAFQFHRRFAPIESQRRAIGGDALDLVPAAVFLLGENGTLIVANATGQGLLDENDGLMARRDGLAAAGHAECTTLRGLIRAAGQTAQGQGLHSGGVMAISRPSRRRPYMVMVVPVGARRFALDGPSSPWSRWS